MSRSRRLVPVAVEVEVRGCRAKHDMKRKRTRLQRRSVKDHLDTICFNCGNTLDQCSCSEGWCHVCGGDYGTPNTNCRGCDE